MTYELGKEGQAKRTGPFLLRNRKSLQTVYGRRAFRSSSMMLYGEAKAKAENCREIQNDPKHFIINNIIDSLVLPICSTFGIFFFMYNLTTLTTALLSLGGVWCCFVSSETGRWLVGGLWRCVWWARKERNKRDFPNSLTVHRKKTRSPPSQSYMTW